MKMNFLSAFRYLGFLAVVIFVGMSCKALGWLLMPNPEQEQAARNDAWIAANTTKVVSEAHLNDASATKTIMDGTGELSVNYAHSTQIVADSNQGPINAFRDGRSEGRSEGMVLVWIVGAIAVFCILYSVIGRK